LDYDELHRRDAMDRITAIIRKGEKTNAEFKSEWDFKTKKGRAGLARRVIGMANACKPAAFIVIGAHENGTPSGFDQTGFDEERVQGIVKEYCEPYVDVALHRRSIGEDVVSVIEIERRSSCVPYRATKTVTVDRDQILRAGHIYYRYGRHVEEARYAEMNSLFREGDRRRGSSGTIADDYRYLSRVQKESAMRRDWQFVAKRMNFRLIRRPYYHRFVYAGLGYHDAPSKIVVPMKATMGDGDYLLLVLVRPSDMAAREVRELAHYLHGLAARSPSYMPRLYVVLCHGSVGRPSRIGGVDAVVEREPFGWYLGAPPSSTALDAHLLFENVRSRIAMEVAAGELVSWARDHGSEVNTLQDDWVAQWPERRRVRVSSSRL